MDEALLWRRLLINNLVESAYRYGLLSGSLRGFVAPVFRALSEERSQLAGEILSDHPDEALREQLGRADLDTTGYSVVEEEARVAAERGMAFAAEFAIEREEDLLDLVGDPADLGLSEPLRLRLTESLRRGIQRLRTAVARTRARDDLINFSRKSSDTTAGGERVYEVWFGTNRAPIVENGAVLGFSGETSTTTTVGRCGVTIPRTHRIGEGQPPWWRRIVFGERPLSLASVVAMDIEGFWKDIRARLVEGSIQPSDAIVFLHGYNVSFEDAAVRCAQIGADLNLPGVMAFFSWPSRGRVHAYSADEASIEASEKQITEFLEAFASRSGARRVHFIAHSMGNRGLIRAMDRIATNAARLSGKSFGQIILAAPDVDRRTFAMLSRAYPSLAARTTLYVSSKDLAVRSSRFVHAAARVGFEPPLTIEPGIDTVSVSKVDLSYLGHGYVAGCRPVLMDIHQLIVSELEPGRRAGLRRLKATDGEYWELAA
ncbi:alpha/beta hydrolase [Aureimonas phyllosphaerae]|uniref:Esterase/lipase superfamily enzyme n=1 Tax=Aureimonas phyllosphaerae TaxID=1166078 RepID=A0A7W6BSR4_9HYPH|nr:alpha/beta hydrolase [Aureimonas phyllosphaerae]MBB3937343.1 esterase/lipase superfamily enzyme [Aureimonas phyllosphaerae]MBB3961350.1 esterase/lipase superfamily enzyme [Aureimonas phyllosphaerae]SFF42158.1 Esterase/lipase superfamily enzyme [Aureimonas phyllosphaerae]